MAQLKLNHWMDFKDSKAHKQLHISTIIHILYPYCYSQPNVLQNGLFEGRQNGPIYRHRSNVQVLPVTVENKNIVWNGLFCREPKDFPFLPDKNEMKVTGPPQVDQEQPLFERCHLPLASTNLCLQENINALKQCQKYV